jgi:hypothetical protein
MPRVERRAGMREIDMLVAGDRAEYPANEIAALRVLTYGAGREDAAVPDAGSQREDVMRRFMIPIIAISIAVAPATLEAQRPGQRKTATAVRPAQRGQTVRPAERGQAGAQAGAVLADPIQRILEHREQLNLTTAQVTRIERIQAQLAEKNRPLMEQLQSKLPEGAARQMVAAQGRGVQPEMRERLRNLPDSVRNLSEEQRRELRERMVARRDSMKDSMPDSAARRTRARVGADSVSTAQRDKMRTRAQTDARGTQDRGVRAGAVAGAKADELRPIVEKIRANTERAMTQVENVLTPEQRAKLPEAKKVVPARRGGGQPR